ncbi:MAG: aminotransferase class V-fold PLP-dependent enzyme [Planctomycetota bacterium]|nr:aminotransferase class V-fold PLP-dependent enzyme [Planctomycetota bacterium]
MSHRTGGPWFCDANAGGPALPEVLEEFVAIERRFPANPSSAHAGGREARGALEQARERVAAAIGARASDVVFTSGGTEAGNLAVRGRGDLDRPVLLGELEHPAVRESARARGCIAWDVDGTGAVIVTPPRAPIGLVAIVHAQSEVGTLQPVEAAADVACREAVPLFVDAAQTLGRVALQPLFDLGAVVALSPHKAGGLRGNGVLVGRDLSARLAPLMHGGGQELGLRPGTPSVALAAANALAIELATETCDQRAEQMRQNRDAFAQAVQTSGCQHQVLTPLRDSVPNTIMMCFDGLDGRSLLPALDLAGVQASHGSACSSGSPTPPPVLAAMSVDVARARSCVRFSFDWFERRDGCARAGATVGEVALRLCKKK